MSKKHTPIAALTNVAELHETYARRADRQERFAMQVQAAFPSLWQHPALGDSDSVTAIVRQWSFSLDGVEFLVRWVPGVRGGGYWAFDAWDDATGKHTAHDSGSYYSPDAETALLCFVGAALRQARVMEGVAA